MTELQQVPFLLDYFEHVNLNTFNVDKRIFRTFDQMNIYNNCISLTENFNDRSFIRILKLSNDEHSHISSVYGSWPMIGDSIIVSNDYLAIKSGLKIQIYNYITFEKINSLDCNELIRFWNFDNNNEDIIVLISHNNVYHWDWKNKGDPVIIFNLFDDLKGYRIMSYKRDSSNRFHLVSALRSSKGQLNGLIQLYSEEYTNSQCITAFAADFYDWKDNSSLNNSNNSTTLLCFVNKVHTFISIHTAEIDDILRPKNSKLQRNPIYGTRYFEEYLPEYRIKDYPVILHCDNKLPIIHVCSKFGYYNIYDIQTGQSIVEWKFSEKTFAVSRSSTNGIQGITREGKVISIKIIEEKLIDWLTSKLSNFKLPMQFLTSYPYLKGNIRPFLMQFVEHFTKKNYEVAAEIASIAPEDGLRHPQILEMFQKLPCVTGKSHPKDYYFQYVLKKPKVLYAFESCSLVNDLLDHSPDIGKKKISDWIRNNKIYLADIKDIINNYSSSYYNELKNLSPDYNIKSKDISYTENIFKKWNVCKESCIISPNDTKSKDKDIENDSLESLEISFGSLTSVDELRLSSTVFQ